MQDLLTKLIQICSTLNPPIHPNFLPPALDSDIANAEEQLGLSFPNDLKHLLLCANGQVVCENGFVSYPEETDPIFPMIRFAAGPMGATSSTWLNGVQAIVETTGALRSEFQDLKDEADGFEIHGPAYYHDHVIGFTLTENSDSLVIDLKPGPGGSVGQVLMVRTQPFQIAVLAPNLSSFMQLVLDGFSSGRFQLGATGFAGDWGDA